MTASAQPASLRNRYGSDARADRFLRRLGFVLGPLFLLLIGWLGWSYVAGQELSGELIKFKVVSDTAVEAHLEVRKDEGVTGTCTIRALAEDGTAVGLKDERILDPASRVDTVAVLRTTARATAAELVGCRAS